MKLSWVNDSGRYLTYLARSGDHTYAIQFEGPVWMLRVWRDGVRSPVVHKSGAFPEMMLAADIHAGENT